MVPLENKLQLCLLRLACTHHTMELTLKRAFESVTGKHCRPDGRHFKNFQEAWVCTDQGESPVMSNEGPCEETHFSFHVTCQSCDQWVNLFLDGRDRWFSTQFQKYGPFHLAVRINHFGSKSMYFFNKISRNHIRFSQSTFRSEMYFLQTYFFWNYMNIYLSFCCEMCF